MIHKRKLDASGSVGADVNGSARGSPQSQTFRAKALLFRLSEASLVLVGDNEGDKLATFRPLADVMHAGRAPKTIVRASGRPGVAAFHAGRSCGKRANSGSAGAAAGRALTDDSESNSTRDTARLPIVTCAARAKNTTPRSIRPAERIAAVNDPMSAHRIAAVAPARVVSPAGDDSA